MGNSLTMSWSLFILTFDNWRVYITSLIHINCSADGLISLFILTIDGWYIWIMFILTIDVGCTWTLFILTIDDDVSIDPVHFYCWWWRIPGPFSLTVDGLYPCSQYCMTLCLLLCIDGLFDVWASSFLSSIFWYGHNRPCIILLAHVGLCLFIFLLWTICCY